MRTMFYRAVLLPLSLFLTISANAATWIIDPADSSVVFQYSYGSDPYEGTFTNVEATFEIDPLSPGSCDFSVTIHIADIDVDSAEVLDYLLDYELFDVDQFPTATFEAEQCRLTGVDSFESDGTLTIRDQTHPITFPFDLDVETADSRVRFRLTSEVTIQRLQFGVGQGYWASTAEVPNEVLVKVDVYAIRQ